MKREPAYTRNAAIDLMRIIACFLVIVNHTNSIVFSNTEPSIEWFLSIIYLYICKCAVPIFLMITGYTMLPRKDSYDKLFRKFLKICLTIVIFSVPYYVETFGGGSFAGFQPVVYLLELWHNPVTMSYWYLYLYAGFMLMLPFMQRLAGAMDRKDFHMFFLLCLGVSSVWPIVVHYKPILQYSSCVELPMFSASFCTVMLGAYLKKWGSECRVSRTICFIMAIISCGFNVVMTYYEYRQTAGLDYLFYDEINYLPIIIEATCIFLILSRIKIREKYGRVISKVASCTFGIYLIADWINNRTQPIYTFLCARGMSAMFAVFIWEIIIFLSALIIVALAKCVKGCVIHLFSKQNA